MTAEARRQDVVELRGYARELADSYWTQTPAYSRTRGGRIKLVGVHRVEQDGLLTQLAEAAALGTTSSDDVQGARPVPQSRPPGAWDALALHSRISILVARWQWDLQLSIRETTQAGIRQLAAAASEPRILDDIGTRLLTANLRTWRTQVQTAVGWTSPLYVPRADCPVLTCGARGTLRVALERRAAYCTTCDSVWDDVDGSIRMLAEHIARTTDNRAAASEPVRSGRQGHGAWLSTLPTGRRG